MENTSAAFAFGRCGIPPTLPPDVPAAVDYAYAAIVLLIAISSTLLNGFIVCLVARHKTLHQRTFYLSLQINVLHLIFSCTVLVAVFVSASVGEWIFGDFMCQIVGFMLDTYASVRFLLMFVLALDRYFTVFLPFFYAKHGSHAAIVFSLAVWIVSVVRMSLAFQGVLDCYTYVPTFSVCTAVLKCSKQCEIFIQSTFSVTILLGGFVPLFLYIGLVWKARRLQKRLTLTDADTNKHERRAIITFAILFASLLGCSVPAFILYMLTFVLSGPPDPAFLAVQKLVGRTFFFSLTIVDAVAIMRNRDVRDVLCHRVESYTASTSSSSTAVITSS